MQSLVLPKSLLKSLIQWKKQFSCGKETTDKDSLQCKSIVSANDAGPFGERSAVKPIKMAFLAFETIRPSMVSKKSPVIFMHEVMDSKGHWASFAKKFHDQTMRKVFAVDARNHGESTHATDMSYLHMAEDVKRFMEEMSVSKCCLVGHGMGGRAAMVLALTYPNLIEHLVVIDASPVRASAIHAMMARHLIALSRIMIDKNLSMSTARKNVNFQLAGMISENLIRSVIIKNLVLVEDAEERFFKWRVNLLSIARNMSSIVKFPAIQGKKVCECPALFIHGENVERLDEKECIEIRRLFPNCNFINISTADHWVHAQNPRDLLECVLEFISGQ